MENTTIARCDLRYYGRVRCNVSAATPDSWGMTKRRRDDRPDDGSGAQGMVRVRETGQLSIPPASYRRRLPFSGLDVGKICILI